MCKKIIYGILVVIGFSINVKFAQATDVSGTITMDTIWDVFGSPYIITSDVIVAQGVTLEIKPNVIVKFATNTSLINYGTLTAIGTPDGTITFTSNEPTPQQGDWRSIKLIGTGSSGSQISYSLIEYAKQGIYLENVTGIIIIHNKIRNNKGDNGISIGWGASGGEIGAGIYLSLSKNNTLIDNTISYNIGGKGGEGYVNGGGDGGIGVGIYLYSSIYNTISTNFISDSIGGTGGGTSYLYSFGGRGNNGVGIYLTGTSTNNNILNNTITNSIEGRGGIGGSRGGDGTDGRGYGIFINNCSVDNVIDSTNKVDGQTVHYYYNQTGIILENYNLTGSPTINLGKIVLIKCKNFVIRNNIISNSKGDNGASPIGHGGWGEDGKLGAGIYLFSSENNEIIGNTILNNRGGNGGPAGGANGSKCGNGGTGTGIYLYLSNNNVISKNTIGENNGGIYGDFGYYGGGGVNGPGMGICCVSSIGINLIYNNIYNNQTYNLQTDISPGTQTAEYNWWGTPIESEIVAKLSGRIDYTPWLTGTWTETVQAQITVSPNFGTIGIIVTVSGENFGATELIRIDFGTTKTITTATTNSSGTFSVTFTVDNQPALGTTTIIAYGLPSQNTASAFFYIIDGISPGSFITTLPTYTQENIFTVSWTGYDPEPSSGIAGYDVQYKDSMGTWTDWILGTTATQAVFTLTQRGHTYYFQCRAKDNQGNQEEYPGGNGDTRTSIATPISGTISTIWTISGHPYVIVSDAWLPSTDTLTIEPGIVIKFDTNKQITVYGHLNAIGTSDGTIIFTSLKEDIIGDTNGDGTSTVPSPGDWNKLVFSDTVSTNSLIDYCVIKYGGGEGVGISISNSSPTISNSVISDIKRPGGGHAYGIVCSNSSAIFTNNIVNNIRGTGRYYARSYGMYITNSCMVFTNNIISEIYSDWSQIYHGDTAHGVYISNSSVIITGGTITSIASYGSSLGYGIYIINSLGTVSNVTVSNVRGSGGLALNGMGIYGNSSTLTVTHNNIYNISSGGAMWDVEGPDNYGIYYENSLLTISHNAIFNIMGGNANSGSPGGGYGIYGRNSNPSTIISKNVIYDITGGTANPGRKGKNSYGIYCSNFSLSIIDNEIHSVSGALPSSGGRGDGYGIYCYNASPDIINTYIHQITQPYGGSSYGIGCDNYSAPHIIHGTITANNTYGIYCVGTSSPTIGSNTITNNPYGIYVVDLGSNPVIYNNNIYGNTNYGIYNNGTPTIINAKYNWWGYVTGPKDTSTGPPDYNPDGQGNKVSDYVAYRPWTGQVVKIVISPISGTIGTIVTVAGEGYGATELIRIDFGTTKTITTATTNAAGTFAVTFTVDNQPAGTTTIIATGLTSSCSAGATFTIETAFVIPPEINLISPSSGTVGTIVTVAGAGFGATETIRLDFGITKTIVITTTTADGSFSTTFMVNNQAFGTTSVNAIGITSGYVAETTFYLNDIGCVFMDEFTGNNGTSPNPAKWKITGNMGTIDIQDNSLRMDKTGGSGNNELLTIQSFDFTGKAKCLFYFNLMLTQPMTYDSNCDLLWAGTTDHYWGWNGYSCLIMNDGESYDLNKWYHYRLRIEEDKWYVERLSSDWTTWDLRGSGNRNPAQENINGYFFFNASGNNAGKVYSRWDNVKLYQQIPPEITIVTPTSGTIGTIVAIQGHGFGSTETVQIDFGTTKTITLTTTNASGQFTTSFIVDYQTSGTKTIIATGLTSSYSAEAIFTIIYFIPPQITLISPTSGSKGALVTIQGIGFGNQENVRIAFGTNPSIATTLTNPSGSFTAIFTVDAQPEGMVTVSATGLTSNAKAYATFTILPIPVVGIEARYDSGENEYPSTPVVGDIDGDNYPEIIFSGAVCDGNNPPTTGHLRVVRKIANNINLVWSKNLGGAPYAPAIGDINNDGIPEIVVYVWDGTGRVIAVKPDQSILWNVPINLSPHYSYWSDHAPVLGDVNGDGYADVALTTGSNLIVLNGTDGSTLWKKSGGSYAYNKVAILDLDNDGSPEVLSAGGTLYVYRSTGTLWWSGNGYDLGVADLDLDGYPEIITTYSGINIYNYNGTLKKSIPFSTVASGVAIADLDLDGKPEIAVGTEDGRVRAINGDDYTDLWYTSNLGVGEWDNPDLTATDLNGDKAPEITVISDDKAIIILDGKTGNVTANTNINIDENEHSPVIADVDNDNYAEVVVPSGSGYNTGGATYWRNLLVFGNDGMWVSTRKVWNQMSYYVTNVKDDLSITNDFTPWKTYNTWRSQYPLGTQTYPPDLTLSPSDISFSNPTPTQGHTITITATIHNNGITEAGTFAVQFFDGNPDSGGVQIGSDKTITGIKAQNIATTSVNWYTTIGTHTIYVKVDPYYNVEEEHENNNMANTTILVYNNPSPTITITAPPAQGAFATTSYTISWTDADPDDNASICLYYDTNNTGYDGSTITTGISEDSPINNYIWDISSVPEGSYYIYAKIEDGINLAVYDYSEGVLRIDRTPATATITTSPASPITIAGIVYATLTASEKLTSASLYYTPSGKSPIPILLKTTDDIIWTGTFSVNLYTGDGIATFTYAGTDTAGNCGTEITAGEIFVIDVSGVIFSEDSYQFYIEKDYDQQRLVRVKNIDNEPHLFSAKGINIPEAIAADFIGDGSQDNPITLQPGEERDIILAIHAQYATQTLYTMQSKLTNDKGLIDYTDIKINVHIPDVKFKVELISEDSRTLVKTYRVTNIGTDPIPDLTITLDELESKVIMQPLLYVVYLGVGNYIEFKLVPIITDEAFQGLCGLWHVSGGGGETIVEVETCWELPDGMAIYKVTLKLPKLVFDMNYLYKYLPGYYTWVQYCPNSPPRKAWVGQTKIKSIDPFYLPTGFGTENVLSGELSMKFTRGNVEENRNTYVYMNNNELFLSDTGGRLENVNPDGYYSFDVLPQHLLYSEPYISSRRNEINMETDLNVGQLAWVGNFRVILSLDEFEVLVVATGSAAATATAWALPYIHRNSDQLFVNIITPNDNFSYKVGQQVLIKAEVKDEHNLPQWLCDVKASFSHATTPINLYDDGKHNDGGVDDGVYANYWSAVNEGSVTITVVAKNCKTQATDTVTGTITMNHPPTVDILSPIDKQILSGTATISWQAQDQDGDELYFYVYYSLSSIGPWIKLSEGSQTSYLWNTNSVNNSTYFIKVIAKDSALTGEDKVEVIVDNIELIATITSPQPNEEVNGTITISGRAIATHFQEYILEYGTGQSPITWINITTATTQVNNGILAKWNTTTDADGTYTLRLRVNTTSGTTTSTQVTIIVDNTPPTITLLSPNGGEIWSGTQTIQWQANPQDTDVLSIDIKYSSNGGSSWNVLASGEENDGSYSWNTLTVPDGVNYLVKVIADDGHFKVEDISDATFIINNIPPIPDITSPAQNSYIKGTTTITVIQINGADALETCFEYSTNTTTWYPIGTDTNAGNGWSMNWNTTLLPDGRYTIKVTMKDYSLAGTDTVRVTVENIPQIILIPTSGSKGALVTVYGNGFGQGEGVQIDFGNHTNITTGFTDTEGSFTTTFTVDSQPVGTVTVSATGLTSAAKAYATFTITSLHYLKGYIRYAKNGNGVPGVKVYLISPTNPKMYITSSDGYYEFTGLPNGYYRLSPYKEWYTFAPSGREYERLDASYDNLDFTGTPHRYYLNGRCKTAAGEGVGGVNVVLSGPTSATYTTNAGGYYGFWGLPEGTYTITPNRPFWAFDPPSITCYVDFHKINQDFVGTGSVEERYYIKGTITDEANAGLPGVRVYLISPTMPKLCITKANGYYEFTNLIPGYYRTSPYKPHYTFKPSGIKYEFLCANYDNQNFGDDGPPGPGSQTTPPAKSISSVFMVVKNDKGKAMEGVQLNAIPIQSKIQNPKSKILPSSILTLTDKDGLADMLQLYGTYEIRASKEGYKPQTKVITITDEENAIDLEFALEPIPIPLPTTNKLYQNYPNPFNPNQESTAILYDLSANAHIIIKIYNIAGELVKTLEEDKPAGLNVTTLWNGRNDDGDIVSSGVYFYQLHVSGSVIGTRKILVVK